MIERTKEKEQMKERECNEGEVNRMVCKQKHDRRSRPEKKQGGKEGTSPKERDE